jgi:hypothetical protein
VVTPTAKRQVVAHVCTAHKVNERRACQALGVDRSTVRYRSLRPGDGTVRLPASAFPAEKRRLPHLNDYLRCLPQQRDEVIGSRLTHQDMTGCPRETTRPVARHPQWEMRITLACHRGRRSPPAGRNMTSAYEKVPTKRARYVGRAASASTATGQMSKHLAQLHAFMEEAFAI